MSYLVKLYDFGGQPQRNAFPTKEAAEEFAKCEMRWAKNDWEKAVVLDENLGTLLEMSNKGGRYAVWMYFHQPFLFEIRPEVHAYSTLAEADYAALELMSLQHAEVCIVDRDNQDTVVKRWTEADIRKLCEDN